ncbi:MAG TPA: peptide deformylase [Gemmatimonadota bacterium]|nr:peptide deformylase [Gemmatimonadota bacterium]
MEISAFVPFDDETPGGLARRVVPVGSPGPEARAAIDRMLYLICVTGHPALSGPQIGFDGRIVVVDLSGTGRRPIVLVDPEVTSRSSETEIAEEGCIQLPGLRVAVQRPLVVGVRARSRSGQTVHLHAGGLLGRILQHHLDHLDGRTLLDRMPAGPRHTYVERLRRRSFRDELAAGRAAPAGDCRDLLPDAAAATG